jgi:MFS superfamily sulfate permease-like transporter
MFYANAQAVQDGVRALASPKRIHTVLLDLDANDEIDITSTEALGKLATALARSDIALGLVHLHGPARALATRAGLLDQIPAGRIHPNIATGVAWAQTQPNQ